MVVVASGLPGAEGAEAVGAYLVAGSHTFTAQQSVTVGGNTYACTGYSLETFGSNTGYYTVWGGATESPDRSYTFTETWDGTPSVRLTWQWTLIDGVERYDASSYPQHGLVAHFDGIRNAGAANAHDASAIVRPPRDELRSRCGARPRLVGGRQRLPLRDERPVQDIGAP